MTRRGKQATVKPWRTKERTALLYREVGEGLGGALTNKKFTGINWEFQLYWLLIS